MSYSYDRYERQRRGQTFGTSTRRGALGYWVPLAITVTVATIGLAAWIWSERREDEDEDYDRGGGHGDSQPPLHPPGYGGVDPGETAYARGAGEAQVEDASMMARMSGALRRTPSPQQIFDGASRKVAAGVAAAGAAVGGALSSIREEDKRDFEDHTRWSEEAESRNSGPETHGGPPSRAVQSTTAVAGASSRQPATISQRSSGTRKKTVVIVVSAESSHEGVTQDDSDYHQEHASILSHLPEHVDPDKTRLFILIYAPNLKQHPLASSHTGPRTASITSSFSNIEHEDMHTPGEETEKSLSSPNVHPSSSSASSLFNALYTQAQTLVEKESMILPFTTPTGHVHILRHLGPEIVYVQERLSGTSGDAVTHISGWVGQVILVVGDEGGHGGLVDSEDDAGHSENEDREKWWEKDSRIGLGKGIEVVEGLRVGEDWRRRVGSYD
ncbi:MAG: hypothetical protein M1830_000316 [Pleopsidium flavum]|nr:MAG: hypothetical protein M1830_000316 [Pleopsidium flavum]